MIWTCIPYCPRDVADGADLGWAYNAFADRFPDTDWMCVLDHDVWQTTKSWYRVLEQAVAAHPAAGAFVATVSRLNPDKSGWQMSGPELADADSYRFHWEAGHARLRGFGAKAIDVTDIEQQGWKPLSGAAFCVSLAAWRAIGGAPSGFSQVDWAIHRRLRAAGFKVYHLPGWLVGHHFNRDRSWT